MCVCVCVNCRNCGFDLRADTPIRAGFYVQYSLRVVFMRTALLQGAVGCSGLNIQSQIHRFIAPEGEGKKSLRTKTPPPRPPQSRQKCSHPSRHVVREKMKSAYQRSARSVALVKNSNRNMNSCQKGIWRISVSAWFRQDSPQTPQDLHRWQCPCPCRCFLLLLALF